ncbi:2-oxoacid dehydrogenases acyltransferase-domain-containing protein [Tricharina praecox]|uniref:2-oxoacid dehydrogenases acyltransferase-domain-containing protein n=1 Tax=Tricharina praecox TaxID=43433 RepID=UPI00221F74EC|nr:2-oxoacid dehydrogenases acyltransferase-domain-containing protein [Tricharina praecox]KAI5850835.1 2-oxoacid dehydrogenases acyltransferase-domain-containing protein [Tricharina praecox]
MPALSPTMTAGNVGTWQKKPGDAIAPGDVLVEIETDKAQMDFEFQEDGVLAKILKQSGEKDVAVGNPIAIVIEEGGDIAAFADFTLADAGGESKPAPKEEKSDEKSEEKAAPAPVAETAEQPKEFEGKLQTVLELDGGRIRASPLAKALALEKGIPLKSVKGTGEGGRITEADVKNYKPSGASSAGAAAAAPTSTDIPLTAMRKVISQRLTESKNTNPHYYVQSSLSVSKLLKLRQALNASANGEYKLSVNDFIIKAVAAALLKVPQVNSSYRESEGIIKQFSTADISVAVATPVGLMTPIVTNAQAKGLVAISKDVKSLAALARDGKLKPEQYQGGTFTISNMGMNPAVERFTAIINPPQAGILAVGAVKKVAVEGKDGGIEWDSQIVFSGSFDHRAVDGAVGAEFMGALKKIVENPLELLL